MQDMLVVLDERGKEGTSEGFASLLAKVIHIALSSADSHPGLFAIRRLSLYMLLP